MFYLDNLQGSIENAHTNAILKYERLLLHCDQES